MPESGRRVFATHTGGFSKTVKAPLKYVYDWCTDYREDDGRLSRSKPRHKVVRAARNRIVRIRSSGPLKGNPLIALELVRLKPPDSWHVDQIDENDLASVDYSLTKLGPRKTRVQLVITERWMTAEHPERADWLRGDSEYWDRLMSALETRYRAGRPAKG